MQVLRQIKKDLSVLVGSNSVEHKTDINRNIIELNINYNNVKIEILPYYKRIILSGDLNKVYLNKKYLSAEMDILEAIKRE